MKPERKQVILEKLASKAKILGMSDEAFATFISAVRGRSPAQADRFVAIRKGRKFGRKAGKAKPDPTPNLLSRRGAPPTRDELVMKGRDAVGIRRAIITPQPRSTSPKAYRGVGGGGGTATSNIGISDRMAKLTSDQRMRTEKLRLYRKGRFGDQKAKGALDFQRRSGRGGNLGTPGRAGGQGRAKR